MAGEPRRYRNSATSLANFHREIPQSRSRLEYAKPITQGLLNIPKGRYNGTDLLSVDEFVDMMAIYETVNLESTGWETALATGSRAKMDYNFVSALSLTYGEAADVIFSVLTEDDKSRSLQLQADAGNWLKLPAFASYRNR